MPSHASPAQHSPAAATALAWRPTKIMNMRDLSKDDDFLSHLLVEKLGTGTVPLHVHKMDASRRLPKTDTQQLMFIVRRLVVTKGPLQHAIRQAVDELLVLPAIRYYLKSYTQKQINAFATHASRYFELYHPSGSIEIAHTSRYSHRTGKSELCILATRYLAPGTVITELKGSMANLTDEEDKELKRTDLRNCDIRRDFSVIHSKQMKKNHLFLGPARFVNHDCDNNCELFREGKYITFRVLKAIAVGEEITAHYGDGYFGKRNRHCLCETCEKNGRGGYAPDHTDDDPEPSSDSSSDDSDSDSDSDSSSSSDSGSDVEEKPVLNINERRTRRGVYATITKDDDTDESENEEDSTVPLANAKDIPADGDIEMSAEVDTASELTSLTPSIPPSDAVLPESPSRSLLTPAPAMSRTPSSSLTSLSSLDDTSRPAPADAPAEPAKSSNLASSPFRSIISTRRQKAKETSADASGGTSVAPSSSATPSGTPAKRVTRSTSSLMLSANLDTKGKGKEKEKASAAGTPKGTTASRDEVNVKKEEVEQRVLRGRPSTANVAEVAKESAPKEKEVPRDRDGKPLPICSTCSSVLPVISVDSKVVWGHEFDKSKKKKNQKMECPRCIRHFAIYQQPWPCRIPPHGSVLLSTPREEMTPAEASTRRVSHKVLPVLDQKLAAAASASASASGSKSKKHERDRKDHEERPAKRRKTDPPPETAASSAKGKKADSVSHVEEPVKRKRGRPRKSSPRAQKHKHGKVKVKIIAIQVKEEEAAGAVPPKTPKSAPPRSESGHSQPRSTNGRFGKKTASPEKQPVSPRAERAAERLKAREDAERKERGEDADGAKGTRTSPRNKNKRANDGAGDADASPRKKATMRVIDVDGNEHDVQMLEAPAHKVLPRPASGFRGGTLFSNPNPLSFALHAWASPVVLDDSSSSEDEKPPVTPEEEAQSPAPDVVDPEELNAALFLPAPVLPRVPSIYKPSPLTFARRRWVSMSMSTSPVGIATAELASREEDSAASNVVKDAAKVQKDDGFSANTVTGHLPWAAVNDDSYLSDGEVSDISAAGCLSPVSDSYPSGLSSTDEEPAPSRLKHLYPAFSPVDPSGQLQHKVTTFAAPELLAGHTPNFIHAGWDSSSDISD